MLNFEKLKKWLHFDNDNLRMFDTGFRGIYSIKNIKKGEIIISVPSKYIIQYSDIENKKLPKVINTNSLVAAFLYLKSNKLKSFFKPYLHSFPKKLDEYIYFYDKSKLNLLKNTSIMCHNTYNFNVHIENIKSDCKIIHNYLLHKKLLLEEHIDYASFFPIFLKFRILVCSRIFGYMKNGKEENGMVPYADLLNHSQNPNTTWYFNDNNNCFEVIATKNIKHNTEIFDSYGDKENVNLIMYYGFSIKNNKFSKLNFMLKDNLINANYDSTFDSLMNQNDNKSYTKLELIEKLKSILESHKKLVKKTDDYNILNIYNDEVTIINKLLK